MGKKGKGKSKRLEKKEESKLQIPNVPAASDRFSTITSTSTTTSLTSNQSIISFVLTLDDRIMEDFNSKVGGITYY